MPLFRLSYVSDNLVPMEERRLLHEMRRISEASKRHNALSSVTGVLAFDESWFVQILEGERNVVWETFERISDDPRHDKIGVIEKQVVDERVFPQRPMEMVALGLRTRLQIEPLFRSGIFNPRNLTPEKTVQLMRVLASPLQYSERVFRAAPGETPVARRM